MGRRKRRFNEAVATYIAELPRLLPGARAVLLPDLPYDDFDGWILVHGPYDEDEDFDQVLAIHGLASDINERFGVDFLVRYEQEEPAHTQV